MKTASSEMQCTKLERYTRE